MTQEMPIQEQQAQPPKPGVPAVKEPAAEEAAANAAFNELAKDMPDSNTLLNNALNMAALPKELSVATASVIAREKAGEIVRESDPDWKELYSILTTTAQTDTAQAAQETLEILKHLKNDTNRYQALWCLLEKDVEAIKGTKEPDKVIGILSDSVILNSEKVNTKDLLIKLLQVDDDTIAALPADEKEQVVQFMIHVSEKLHAGISEGDIKELREAIFSPPDGDSAARNSPYNLPPLISGNPGKGDDYAVPLPQKIHNLMRYYEQLEPYAREHLAEATDSLSGMLAGSVVKGADIQENLWRKFSDFVTSIDIETMSSSGKSEPVIKTDRAEAQKDIAQLWASLPPEDKEHQKLLKSLALQTGMVLGSDGAPIVKPSDTPSSKLLSATSPQHAP